MSAMTAMLPSLMIRMTFPASIWSAGVVTPNPVATAAGLPLRQIHGSVSMRKLVSEAVSAQIGAGQGQ